MRATRRIDSTGIAHPWDACDNDCRRFGTNASLGLALRQCGNLCDGAAQDIDSAGRMLSTSALAYLDSCEIIVRVNAAQQVVDSVTICAGGAHDFGSVTEALAWMYDRRAGDESRIMGDLLCEAGA